MLKHFNNLSIHFQDFSEKIPILFQTSHDFLSLRVTDSCFKDYQNPTEYFVINEVIFCLIFYLITFLSLYAAATTPLTSTLLELVS